MLVKSDPIICLRRASAPSVQVRMFQSCWYWSSGLSLQQTEVEACICLKVLRFFLLSTAVQSEYQSDWSLSVTSNSLTLLRWSLRNREFTFAELMLAAWLLHHSVVCKTPRRSAGTEILKPAYMRLSTMPQSKITKSAEIFVLTHVNETRNCCFVCSASDYITACATWIQIIKKSLNHPHTHTYM